MREITNTHATTHTHTRTQMPISIPEIRPQDSRHAYKYSEYKYPRYT